MIYCSCSSKSSCLSAGIHHISLPVFHSFSFKQLPFTFFGFNFLFFQQIFLLCEVKLGCSIVVILYNKTSEKNSTKQTTTSQEKRLLGKEVIDHLSREKYRGVSPRINLPRLDFYQQNAFIFVLILIRMSWDLLMNIGYQDTDTNF